MTTTNNNVTPLSWRPSTWLREAGHPFTKAHLYNEIRAGRIEAAKAGRCTIILTSPAQYLASLPRGVGAPVGRRRRTA
jgi:hypothetical protein